MADLMHDVVDDKLLAMLKSPFWNTETTLCGVGAATFIFCYLCFGLDRQAEEFCGEVSDSLNFR